MWLCIYFRIFLTLHSICKTNTKLFYFLNIYFFGQTWPLWGWATSKPIVLAFRFGPTAVTCFKMGIGLIAADTSTLSLAYSFQSDFLHSSCKSKPNTFCPNICSFVDTEEELWLDIYFCISTFLL